MILSPLCRKAAPDNSTLVLVAGTVAQPALIMLNYGCPPTTNRSRRVSHAPVARQPVAAEQVSRWLSCSVKYPQRRVEPKQ
jgi:hypothetical protein